MPTESRRPRPAKDRVYDWVKEHILDGDFPGGELLSEGEVAQALRVSRTPVREAFLLLEAEGLMRLYPKRGALVVPVSPDEVRDVMETRLLLERHAVARAAAAADPEVVLQLDRLIARQADLLDAGDLRGFVGADRDFHHAIVHAAGNRVLTKLSDSLRDRQRRMVAASVARDPDVPRGFVAEHRAILDAIATGRPDDAVRLVETHLERSRQRIESARTGEAPPPT